MEGSAAYEPLSAHRIRKESPFPVTVLSTVDSTNTEARRRILSGRRTPQFILAEEQTAGRGRMGRNFYSPRNTGIYLTLCFPASSDADDALPITTAAAVAVHRAIRSVTGITTGIKWVNDLYHKGRKVSGILAEAMTLEETRYVILGVGVNLYTEDFPRELSEIAGSLSDAEKGLRNRLAGALCRELAALTHGINAEDFLEAYRSHSLVLGRQIVYTENGQSRSGRATEIDESGRLTVRHEDGSCHVLASGEISLRLNDKESEQ